MVDYSKWKDIEISDDEDDTHPNIDTPSLFRWRHQARVERMSEKEIEKKQLQDEQTKYEERVRQARDQLAAAEACADAAKREQQRQQAEKKLSDLQKDMQKVQLKHQELEKKEKLEPWNVDTISQAGFDKSLINKDDKTKKVNMTEEEREQEMKDFVKANEKLIKQYGLFRRYEDSMKFMQEHTHLANENTANYLVIWCINLQLEEKNELMRHVAHQAICLQFVLELAGQLDRDPRSCISAFFHRIQKAEPEYQRVFNDELSAFISRIERRAKEKIAEAEREAEEEEKRLRLGPGGLDPLEVLEELPQELRDCFESQDIGRLKQVVSSMDPAVASEHMKRCVAAGLWVPEKGASGGETDPNTGLVDKKGESDEEGETGGKGASGSSKKAEEENIYERVEDTVD